MLKRAEHDQNSVWTSTLLCEPAEPPSPALPADHLNAFLLNLPAPFWDLYFDFLLLPCETHLAYP